MESNLIKFLISIWLMPVVITMMFKFAQEFSNCEDFSFVDCAKVFGKALIWPISLIVLICYVWCQMGFNLIKGKYK